MTLWVMSLAKSRGQFRLTIPKQVIEAKGWQKDKYLLLEDKEKDKITVGRLKINGKKAVN